MLTRNFKESRGLGVLPATAPGNSDIKNLPAREIPLNIGPLLNPYRGRGKISIRIERLPQLSRLSAGHNNGNNTWSVGLDELEGLTYLQPASPGAERSLDLRIISWDGEDASTLALLPVEISSPAEASEPGLAPSSVKNTVGITQERRSSRRLKVIEDIDCSLQPSHSQGYPVRTGGENCVDWEELRAEFEQVNSNRENGSQESAEIILDKARAVWNEERDTMVMQHAIQLREVAAAASSSARDAAQRDLSAAESNWRKAELFRFAAHEAQWIAKEKSALAVAEKRYSDLVQKFGAKENELGMQLEVAMLSLEREKSIVATATAETAKTAGVWQKKLDIALSEAKRSWQQLEARRIVELEERYAQSASQKCAVIAVESSSGDEVELCNLREAVEQLTAEVKRRDQQIAAFRNSLDENSAHSQALMTAAEANWKEGEAIRFAAAEEIWKVRYYAPKVEAPLAHLKGFPTMARGQEPDAIAQKADTYTRDLNREIKNLRGIVVDREVALALAHASLEKLRGVANQPRNHPSGGQLSASGPSDDASKTKHNGTLVRDAAVLMIVVMSVILLFPTMEHYFPDEIVSPINYLFGPQVPAAPVVENHQPITQSVSPGARFRSAIAAASVKLHSKPSTTGAIVGLLKRGGMAEIIGSQGDWDRVLIAGTAKREIEGWLRASRLIEKKAIAERRLPAP